jgi:hypothetical protein
MPPSRDKVYKSRSDRPTRSGPVRQDISSDIQAATRTQLDTDEKINTLLMTGPASQCRIALKPSAGGTDMPSTQYFEELYGVTEERALNFWASNLHEAIGSKQWSQISDSTGVYLASVLGHFCLQSVDRAEVLSPDYNPGDQEFRQFADLTQIAELMMCQLTSAKNPLWMESAGAHILLYAGFFQTQNKHRHNIAFYSAMGKECYLMAAVGKREKIMKLMAAGFDQYLCHMANLYHHLRESRYLIRTVN